MLNIHLPFFFCIFFHSSVDLFSIVKLTILICYNYITLYMNQTLLFSGPFGQGNAPSQIGSSALMEPVLPLRYAVITTTTAGIFLMSKIVLVRTMSSLE